MARISVGIVAYNEAAYVAEAIGSVLAQTRPADEVLVFDNASTDGTPEIAASMLETGGVRSAERNTGAAENFNRAARECSGNYFAWLAADDLMAPEYLERTAALLDADPNVDAAFCYVDYFDNAGRLLYHDRPHALNEPSATHRIRTYLRRVRWCEVYSLYRRDALLASPMFQADYGSDVLLGWWFVLRDAIRVVESPLLRKRVDDRDRSDAAMVQGLGAAPRRRMRPRAGLWRALWRDAGRPGVPVDVRRLARRELLLAALGRHWLQSFAADYLSIGAQQRIKRRIEGLRGRPIEQSQ